MIKYSQQAFEGPQANISEEIHSHFYCKTYELAANFHTMKRLFGIYRIHQEDTFPLQYFHLFSINFYLSLCREATLKSLRNNIQQMSISSKLNDCNLIKYSTETHFYNSLDISDNTL